MVLPPEDISRPASCKTARTVQERDRSAAEAAVDVDVPAVVVVAAAVVEVPPRSCVDIFTVLPPRILTAQRAGRLLVWSRRVTARSPTRRPSADRQGKARQVQRGHHQGQFDNKEGQGPTSCGQG